MSLGAGLYRALGGVRVATRQANTLCREGAERFDAAETPRDIRSALNWMRENDFLFAEPGPDGEMRSAYDRAVERCGLPAPEAREGEA